MGNWREMLWTLFQFAAACAALQGLWKIE